MRHSASISLTHYALGCNLNIIFKHMIVIISISCDISLRWMVRTDYICRALNIPDSPEQLKLQFGLVDFLLNYIYIICFEKCQFCWLIDMGPTGTNFSEIWVKILVFSYMKMNLSMSFTKSQPFCLSSGVLKLNIPSSALLGQHSF